MKDAGDELDDLDLLIATHPCGMTPTQLLDEFRVLQKVRDATAFCKTNFVHEQVVTALANLTLALK